MGHDEDIRGEFETFVSYLGETLANLYNPLYSPHDLIWSTFDCNRNQGVENLWNAVLRSIEDLKPAPDSPPQARGWRLYELMSLRYVKHLTQERTAEKIGITTRHLRREQQHAVRLLAGNLWDQRVASHNSKSPVTTHVLEKTSTQSGDHSWRLQIREELASLKRNTPNAVSNLDKKLTYAIELSQSTIKNRRIAIHVQPNMSNALVDVHPSVLNQILLECLGSLIDLVSDSPLSIDVQRFEQHVLIQFQVNNQNLTMIEIPNLVQEFSQLEGLSVRSFNTQSHVGIDLELPLAHEQIVLVIDDNLDLVHFYQRYTTNTRYRIIHLEDDQDILERTLEIAPDLIVLDVMLPDTDGWELLNLLQHNPITRSIPVAVCSVTQGKELAASLGAMLYIQKPVGRRQFLEALDQISGAIQQQS